jgi:aerobic carbon-monoxide dehydrogenase medium subunit
MKPARFDYHAPATLDEAVRLLAEHGDEAKLLAGGQSLVPMMNLRLAQPSVVIDLNRVSEMAYLRPDGEGRIALGAMSRHHSVATSDLLRDRCPLLASAAARIGYPAIRYRGTLGGSLAHADPVAEMPCVALTLGAELVAIGPGGERVIPADDFFLTYFTTALEPDELLREIRFPAISPGEGWSFHESARKTGDFAIVAVAAQVRVGDGVIEQARLGIAGISDRPVRAADAEQALAGQPLEIPLDEAADRAAATVDSASDIHASADFRRRLVAVLTRRALEDALTMAGGVR